MSASANADSGSIGGDGSLQQRKGAVLQFHGHAFECAQCLRYLEHLENDRLVRAEHVAGGDPEEDAVADLPRRSGHCDPQWMFTHGLEVIPEARVT